MKPGLYPLCLGALFTLTACTNRQAAAPSHPGNRFAVCVAQAPIYQNGPAQSNGPDLFLHRSDRVTLVDTKLGYSRVVTDAGFDGYMATRQLRPAPPEPVIATPAPVIARTATTSVPQPEPAPGLDLFDVFTPSQPVPKTPAAAQPQFR